MLYLRTSSYNLHSWKHFAGGKAVHIDGQRFRVPEARGSTLLNELPQTRKLHALPKFLIDVDCGSVLILFFISLKYGLILEEQISLLKNNDLLPLNVYFHLVN